MSRKKLIRQLKLKNQKLNQSELEEVLDIFCKSLVDSLKQGQNIVFDEVCRRHGDYAMAGLIANIMGSKNDIKDLKLVFFATGDKPDIADKTAELYLDNGYDYDKLKNSLSSEIDFAGDLNSSSEMKLHLATVLIKKVLSKLEN